MPSKYQEYRQMADTAERQLTSSYKSWTHSWVVSRVMRKIVYGSGRNLLQGAA